MWPKALRAKEQESRIRISHTLPPTIPPSPAPAHSLSLPHTYPLPSLVFKSPNPSSTQAPFPSSSTIHNLSSRYLCTYNASASLSSIDFFLLLRLRNIRLQLSHKQKPPRCLFMSIENLKVNGKFLLLSATFMVSSALYRFSSGFPPPDQDSCIFELGGWLLLS